VLCWAIRILQNGYPSEVSQGLFAVKITLWEALWGDLPGWAGPVQVGVGSRTNSESFSPRGRHQTYMAKAKKRKIQDSDPVKCVRGYPILAWFCPHGLVTKWRCCDKHEARNRDLDLFWACVCPICGKADLDFYRDAGIPNPIDEAKSHKS
jgi:hypothetical protein